MANSCRLHDGIGEHMSKKYSEFVTEAIGNKYTNHQILSKHGYEHGGNDEYFHKKRATTVKLHKDGSWTHGKVKGVGSLSLAKRMRDLEK